MQRHASTLTFSILSASNLFTSSNGLSRAIRRILRSVGANDHSGHGLRVTAACILKESGCSDDLVAAIAGHNNMKSLGVYLKEVKRQGMAREAIAKRVAARSR